MPDQQPPKPSTDHAKTALAPAQTPRHACASMSIYDWLILFGVVLGILVIAYIARVVLIPVIGAVLLSLTLSPLFRMMNRLGVPRHLMASFFATAVTAALFLLIMLVSQLLGNWVERAPAIAHTLQERLEVVREPIEAISQATGSLSADPDDAQQHNAGETSSDPNPAAANDVPPSNRADAETKGDQATSQQAATAPSAPPDSSSVVLQALIYVMGQSMTIFAGVFICIVLTFFLLLSGEVFLAKLLSLFPRLSGKKHAMTVLREIESSLSRFIGVWTLINLGVGLVVWLGFAIVGVPQAWVWGVAAMLFNYIPYAGPWALGTVALIMGVVTFDNPMLMLLPPAIILVVNVIEGFIISPVLHGKRLNLNTVAVFLSVVVGGWVWGIPGALMAVPLLVVTYVLCSHIPSLQSLALFLDDTAPGMNRGEAEDKGDVTSFATPPVSSGGTASAEAG